MNPERWQQISLLCHRALERKADDRAAYLREACADDAELRLEVESLLSDPASAERFLATGGAFATGALHRPPSGDSVDPDRGASPRITPGTQLGPYRVEELLGAGGMGEVFRARDTRLHRTVAIKVLPLAWMADPDRRSRFLQEARAVSALTHPNIITLYDLALEGERDFLVMEYVPGQSLDRLIAQRKLTAPETLAYAMQIANALAAAHAAGIVHRDIKPANIIVTGDAQVKVLDFGLAKLAASVGADSGIRTRTRQGMLTKPGMVMGTVAYMSPEQARGEAVDARSDLFSCGAVLFEMATGRQAFSKAFDWTPPPPQLVQPELRPIVFKLLEPNPDLRYQTAADLVADLRRLQRTTETHGTRPRWPILAATLAVAIAPAVWLWSRPPKEEPWVPLTTFPDSVSQPAVSRDGRMLTFVRGPGTFVTTGEIYVKLLPDGEPVQLTRDNLIKMSPVFSPDGSRIAYTVNAGGVWDTWVVAVLNGQPHRWLPNASGLLWLANGRLLFSEIKKDLHMAIVAADESRGDARDVYVPASDRGMAHRSSPSPDDKWTLVVEMDRGQWLPCRIVPIDGNSTGRQIGPPGAGCTFAAWSPDGQGMYVNASAGGAFHIWRQRFPDGVPVQVTSGLAQEEGLAMMPDGRSFITGVGQTQSSVWVHNSHGERQISVEGYSYDPQFTPDGKQLCYRILKGAVAFTDPSELRVVDLESGRDEPLLHGLLLAGRPAYDISPDGQQVVAAVLDRGGKHQLWLTPLDQHSPPRRIPNVDGDMPYFGTGGEIFFRGFEGTAAYAYRVRDDGTALQKVIALPIAGLEGISLDREWLVLKLPGDRESRHLAIPLRGGEPLTLLPHSPADIQFTWSPGGRDLFIAFQASGGISEQTYVVPLSGGPMLPDIPAGGFESEADVAKRAGTNIIRGTDVAPAPTPDTYAFSRTTTQRNLYRVPIR